MITPNLNEYSIADLEAMIEFADYKADEVNGYNEAVYKQFKNVSSVCHDELVRRISHKFEFNKLIYG